MDAVTNPRKIVLVGHCGPDATYLRIAVKSAIGDASLVSVDDQASLEKMIAAGGVDLILFNRELDYGFEPATGVEMIRKLAAQYPALKMMLITNYAEVQAAALAAGAQPGFGKRELGSARAKQLLRDALGLVEKPA